MDKKHSILIVDDTDSNILTLRHILYPENKVYVAKSGQRSIELAKKHLPDVILLDIIMPEMDGYEVFSILKNTAETAHIPIIFITGLTGDEHIEKGLEMGAADYITKPFKASIVKLRVGNQIQIIKQREMRIYKKMVGDLEEALEEARAANKSKDNFLATMSHEIRTPLNAIIGITQIELMKDNLQDVYKPVFELIYNSSSNLLGIINDILDLSKIETGKMNINPMVYDVPSLINDAVQMNIIRIGLKKIAFILDADENLPSRLFGDELRIKQILSNLLSNAIKYTDEGYVKLTISSFVSEDNDVTGDTEGGSDTDLDVFLKFRVEDTGRGIKHEDQKNLFSEYLRFNMETNRAIEGTGIGLRIARNLIELMDGKIEVKSEYGKGSIFTVIIKQKAVDRQVIGKELSSQLHDFSFSEESWLTKDKFSYEPMPYGKVLVVDDAESNLLVAKGLLSPYKLTIDTVNSGIEAIERIVAREKYDIIFMDHMMPEMDGMETTQKLRSMGYEEIIIALTANALAGNRELFLENGFNDFIPKPIDIRDLNTALNKYIRDRHPTEARKYRKVLAETDSILQADINPKLIEAFLRDAGKTIKILEEADLDDCDFKLLTTTIHAIKPALANIGEHEKSGFAAKMEYAGRRKDKVFLAANMGKFIVMLKSLTGDLNKQRSAIISVSDIDNITQEDTAFLKQQLMEVIAGCENYDDVAVYAALDLLKEKSWKNSTIETLDKIRDTIYLDSEFDTAMELAAKAVLPLEL